MAECEQTRFPRAGRTGAEPRSNAPYSSDVHRTGGISQLCLAGVVACLTLAAPVKAQQYSFRYYGTADGLTNLAVKVLFQDHTGFLWAATENGVFRYDGQRFRRYGTGEGLPREVIVSLGEAPDGSLLAGCRAGIYYLQGERFESLAVPGGGSVDAYSAIQSDGQGRTYISTERGLVVAANASGGGKPAFRLLPTPEGAGGPDAHGVFIENSAVWYGCGGSLCRMTADGVTVFGKKDGLPPRRWTCIRRDNSGDLWLNDKRRFAVLRRGSPRFDASSASFPPTAGGGQLAVDAEGKLLVPTIQGLIVVDGQVRREVGKREGLRAPVYSVLQDREGSIWLGLAGRGLARWQGYGEWEGFASDSGLDSQLIYEILPLADGSLWIGTENGLFRGRKTGDRWVWRRHPAVGKIPVHAVRLDRVGNLWLGTEGYGVGRLDARAGTLEWFRKEQGLAGEFPASLVVDRSQRIWAATEHGLFVNQPSQKRFQRVDEVPPVRCWVVTEAPGGEILAGTVNGLFWLSGGRWRRISMADGLRDDRILAITASKPHEIWVGYWFSGGVTRIRMDEGRLSMTHYGREAGLRGELTYFLGFDARGQLWAGTDQGVRSWDGDGWKQYDQDDGLIWNDCDLGSFAADPDGAVWIGTSGGLARFKPSRTKRPAQPPSAVFTRLMLGNTAVDGNYVSMGRASNSLAAQYSSLAFAHESSLLFRYRLQPLFSEWRETTLRELQFPGLPANDYRLEVQARDRLGEWSTQPVVFAFQIRPPWWRSWWYQSLMAAVAFLILWIAWRWRVFHLMRRQRELERAVAERTQELRKEKHELLLVREVLRERAIKDGLTGLFNRNAFFEILEKEFARGRREIGSLTLIMADLDFFKKVNDTYGHMAGDAVLKECASRIQQSVRSYDTVGRYGGEELVILLPGCGSEEAAARAEKMRQSIAQHLFATPAGAISVTCSFGVGTTNGIGTTPQDLVAAADRALYAAKEKGRNSVALDTVDDVCTNPRRRRDVKLSA
jgi:diguanylate cyclase (GGDEF)-like protein